MTRSTVLGLRALNRATLTRQLLTERADLPALDVLTHLVGMQAQAPFPPYYGLWTRLRSFDPTELADALLARRAVRIALMRGTVHLVTAADACLLRPLVQPIMDRGLRTNTQHAAALTGLDLGEVADATRAVLAERPHTAKELGVALAARWPDRPAASLAHAARGLVPLVQIPPRAVWGRSGQTTYQTAQDWLGRPLERAADLRELVTRYLTSFGPATVADLQAWSGLTRLREVVAGMELRTYTDEQGCTLYDLPASPPPDADLPVPVRFLPEFDNVLLSYADRTRIMSEEHRKRLFGVPNGVFPATFLVDGFVRGTWRISKQRTVCTLTVSPWAAVSTKDADALTREGDCLLAFAEPDAETREVRVAEPS